MTARRKATATAAEPTPADDVTEQVQAEQNDEQVQAGQGEPAPLNREFDPDGTAPEVPLVDERNPTIGNGDVELVDDEQVAEHYGTDRTDKERARADFVFGRQPRTVGEEIAFRTTETDKLSDTRFRRSFTFTRRDWDEFADTYEGSDQDRANQLGTLSSAIGVGLHPTEEARFDGAEDHEGDPLSVDLWYSVAVVPAALDATPANVVTPGSVLRDLPGGTTAQDQVAERDAK